LDLADGSEIVALASTGSEMVLLLQRGGAHFRIVPGGPQRWIVEAGIGRVEVVGTEFWVERQAQSLSVQVSRGQVLVRSTLLADGVRSVGPGESVLLDLLDATRPENSSARPAPAPTAEVIGMPKPRDETSARAVVPAAPTRGPATDPVAALLHEADEARLHREFARAARILERVVNEHPRDSRASLSSYSRGVLQLRQLGQPERAASSFERALALGASRSLREDCYLAWLESELRRGGRERADELFARYLDEFPEGRHRQEMTRLIESDSPRPE
jgi:hypothetical protein